MFVVASIALDIFAICVLMVVMGYLIYHRHVITLPVHSVPIAVCAIVFLLSDVVYQALLGSTGTGARAALFVAKSVYFVANAILVYLWASIVMYLVWKNGHARPPIVACRVLLGINAVLVVANFAFPVLFDISSEGTFVVHALGLWIFTFFNYAIFLVGLAVLLYRHQFISHSVLLPFLLFPIPPICGEIASFAFRDLSYASLYGLGVLMLFCTLLTAVSYEDKLTHLGNRALLEMRLQNWLVDNRKNYVCGIMLDIDDLKKSNDAFGHAVGDEILVAMARILKKAASRERLPVRYGGDEFLLIWTAADDGDIEFVQAGLGALRDEYNKTQPRHKQLNFSCRKIVCPPTRKITAEGFLTEVDMGLYQVRRELAEQVKDALVHNRLEMFYQPVYSITQERYRSAEALLRIYDAEGTMLPTEPAIRAAETCGIINELGDRVLDMVCDFIANRLPEEYGLTRIAVNFSVAQCMQEGIAQKTLNTMRAYDLNVSKLIFEITETAFSTSTDLLVDSLHTIEESGLRLSLDDFGSGYSNLVRLANLPVNVVKFDKDIIAEYTNPRIKTVLVESVRMIHDLGYDTVIEGIETREQFDAACAFECDYIQGFYLARPMPESRFLEFLKEH